MQRKATVALPPVEQALLVAAAVTGCVNTALQIARSIFRRKEAQERRRELAERRAFQQWLFDHGAREEEKSDRIIAAVRERNEE